MANNNQQPSNEGLTTDNSDNKTPQQNIEAVNSTFNEYSDTPQQDDTPEIEAYDSLEDLMAAYADDDKDTTDDTTLPPDEFALVDEWLNGGSTSDEQPIHQQSVEQGSDYREEQDDYEEEDDDEDDYEEEDDYENDEPVDVEPDEPINSDIDGGSKTSLGNVLGRMTSAKNLERMGKHGLDKLDDAKARLCAKLDGERHASEFASDKMMKDILVENFKEMCKEMQIELPPAGVLFFGSLAMYSAPVIALLMKKYGEDYLLPLMQKATSINTPAPAANNPPTKAHKQRVVKTNHPYEHTPSFKKKRTYFQRHASGAFKYTIDKKITKANLADEYPHPDIAELLDDMEKRGVKGVNKKMRELLYGA
jgi:hypothetical protein